MFFRTDISPYMRGGRPYTAQEVLDETHRLMENLFYVVDRPAPPALASVVQAIGQMAKRDPAAIGEVSAKIDPVFRNNPLAASWRARVNMAQEGVEALGEFPTLAVRHEQVHEALHTKHSLYEQFDTDTLLFGSDGRHIKDVIHWLRDDALVPMVKLNLLRDVFPQMLVLQEGSNFVLLLPRTQKGRLPQLQETLYNAGHRNMLQIDNGLRVEGPSAGLAETLVNAMDRNPRHASIAR